MEGKNISISGLSHTPERRRRQPIFVSGTIASSDKLIKAPAVLMKWLEASRDIKAIEMETAGVYKAAHMRTRTYPVVAIRAISDVVGLTRDPAWTTYACEVAGAFLRAFLSTFPVDTSAMLPITARNSRHRREQAATRANRVVTSNTTLPPPLRVLLLSTERDLGVSRAQIAQYLQQAFGIRSEQTINPANERPYDAAFLLQGWLWDDGQAAHAWERSIAKEKFVFASRPDGEWPPIRLVDLGSHSLITQFRDSNPQAVLYETPQQLPEKIGEHVSRILDQRNNATAGNRGLRKWERQYLDFRIPAWTAGRTAGTGLLRFEQADKGPEQIRFWHRLFREYLAASRLSREDIQVFDLVNVLASKGRLVDPFWEDVIRLLPSALGTREKAAGLKEALESLARTNVSRRGRYLGLICAAIVESRGLFPGTNFNDLAIETAKALEGEGKHWPTSDRLLVLQGLGRLDPSRGDPRLARDPWVTVPHVSFQWSWAPVTVQEYARFVNASDRNEDQWWTGVPPRSRGCIGDVSKRLWRRQLRFPNSAVVSVTVFEVEAYCKWVTAHGATPIRLPTFDEWYDVARECYPAVGETEFRNDANIVHFSQGYPVGTNQKLLCHGIADLVGPVYFLMKTDWKGILAARLAERVSVNFRDGVEVAGGDVMFRQTRFARKKSNAKKTLPVTPLYAPLDSRIDVIGFRCVREEP